METILKSNKLEDSRGKLLTRLKRIRPVGVTYSVKVSSTALDDDEDDGLTIPDFRKSL